MEENMSKTYEPDSQYVERLEWQLSSEYRRANRLKSFSGKIAVPRGMVAIAVVVGILMTGVAVTKAADYIKDSWRKKIEVARIETDILMKKAHHEFAAELALQAKERFSNGLIREEEYLTIKLAADRAQLDRQRSQLNLDEVNMSGEAPRNELYAPLVGGRDFVSDRLMLEKKDLEMEIYLLMRHLKRYKQLAETGLIQNHELEQVQTESASQELRLDKLLKRLDLRISFLEGELTAQEVEIQDRMTAAERNLHLAQTKVKFLKEQLERLEKLESLGTVTHMEVLQLQYAFDAAKAELNLASVEMNVLRNIK
jgi:multidrug resistance efflux pump